MQHDGLQAFLDHLEVIGELRRVSEPVSPMLEVTARAQAERLAPSPQSSPWAAAIDPGREGLGGKALLLEKIEGCDFPLCINVFGSYHRMALALGCEERGFEAIADRIAAIVEPKPPRGIGETLALGRRLLPLLRMAPKLRRSGPCGEVVKITARGEVDLRRLPLIKCWPLDGDPLAVGYDMSAEDAGTAGGEGRYITCAGMHTIHADDRDDPRPRSHNIGMYRAQLLGPTSLSMHWHVCHDGAAHWRSWKKIGQPMPIAICFGGEPELPYAATAPLPPGMSELLMAGFLRGRGIDMVRCKTVPLRVPASSEIVIEGFVRTDCGEPGWEPGDEPLGDGAVFEGPFGDHTGFYSLPDRYPIVDVTALTHRVNAVFPATVVGPPPQEDYYLGKATERIFLPLLKVLIPDIVDYHLPRFGTFHNCVFVQIEKSYPEQARRVMHAVWGAGQMAVTKMVIVVDRSVDVHDEEAVLAMVAAMADIPSDIEIVRGPLDILDHASPFLGSGGKMGIDATTPLPAEGRRVVAMPNMDEVRRVAATFQAAVPEAGGGRIILLPVDKKEAGQGVETLRSASEALPEGADVLIAVDASVDTASLGDSFFHLAASFDPLRDAHFFGDRLCLDGTPKLPGDGSEKWPVRRWPPPCRL
ncbi:MAG: UbiD family decarboxylase [Phycisphaerales bacterium]|nr:UbiD family decarboxylase [Phycisphaerales bacterium]